MGVEKKYQHLIPRVHMKQWASRINKEKGKDAEVLIYKHNKENPLANGIEINTKDIGGIEDYHTITEYSPFLTEDDLKRISNGEERILDIEDGWQKQLENNWQSLVNKINNDVLQTKKQFIQEFKKDEIITLMVCMMYRGFKGIDVVREYVSDIILKLNLGKDLEEKFIEFYIQDNEVIKNHLLSSMRSFIQGKPDTLIAKMCELHIDNTTIAFMIAPDDIEFITTDNPSFECTMSFLNKEGGGTVHIMPITPKVALILLRDSDKEGKYKIIKSDIQTVKNLNKVMIESSVEFIISSKENISSML